MGVGCGVQFPFSIACNHKIETAPYFSFLCFTPTPTNNKDKRERMWRNAHTQKQDRYLGHLSFADDFIPPPLSSTVTVDSPPARPFPLGVHDRAFGPCRYFGTVSDPHKTTQLTPVYVSRPHRSHTSKLHRLFGARVLTPVSITRGSTTK